MPPDDAPEHDAIRALVRERERLQREHLAGAPGAGLARLMASAVDTAVARLWAEIVGAPREVALVALGGYGRGQLSPYSDLDLMVLHRGGGRGPEAARGLFYTLWDAGFEVGHAVRSVRDCVALARTNFEVETSLLDARLVVGDAALLDELTDAATRQTRKRSATFLARIGRALDTRHVMQGRASAMLEPNLKEGAGGLRDVHALGWLGRVFDRALVDAREADDLASATELLHRVRNQLHYAAGRRQDVLLLHLQEPAAGALGWSDAEGWSAWDAFMRDVYRATRAVEHALGQARAELEPPPRRRAGTEAVAPGIAVAGGTVTIDATVALADRPELAAGAFAAAAARRLRVSPSSLRDLRDALASRPGPLGWTPEVRASFDALLAAGDEHALETFDHVGAMLRYLPEWEPVRFRPQHNVYHRFTVDVHAYETVVHLARAGRDGAEPIFAAAYEEVRDRETLLLAALLHDIGKGAPGDHSEAGERAARAIAARIGLDAPRTETLAWLVRNHLLLVEAATRRDTSDEAFVTDLAGRVGDPELLRMLYTLTVADGLGTGPTAWTRWKSSLVAELFTKLAHVLEGGEFAPDTRQLVRDRIAGLREALKDRPAAEVDAHITAMPRAYFVVFPTPALVRHYELMAETLPAGRIRAHVERTDERGLSELTLVAADRPGLFSIVSGALALNGINVVTAQIFTRRDGAALEVFGVTGALDPVMDDARWERVFVDVRAGLAGRVPFEDRLEEKRRAYVARPPKSRRREVRVIVDNAASDFYTVVEVHAPDRIGLLYAITRALADLGMDIHVAKVATFGEDVVDAFYVRDLERRRIEDPERIAELERRIVGSLETGSATAGSNRE